MSPSWFEFLFKFNRLNFSEGAIGFQSGRWGLIFGVVVLGLAVVFVTVYTLTKSYRSPGSKVISLGLRLAALGLLCLPLFEPVLIMPDVVPDENFVAVVVDASESMTIPDGQLGENRAGDALHALMDEDDGVLDDLEEHFKLRYYTFSNQAERVDSLGSAGFTGKATNLSAALERVVSDFKGVPLAGIVVLTDGGDNSTEVPLNMAEHLRALDIPLHLVGVGQEAFAQERELLEVTVSEGVEETTGAEIDVKVRSWATEEAPVTFDLYRGADKVETFTRRLKGDGKIDQLTFFYEPSTPGANEYRLNLNPAPDELNADNNDLDLLIDTRKDTIRVLYIEGQLRRELKFMKRTLEDDQVIEIVSASRTNNGRLYRQGLSSPDQIAGGFPADREELYRYKGLILGDVEAAYFTPEQLRMIEDFVRDRGGGFAMLGGQNSFVEGDYWNTPIASLLPVELDLSRRTVLPPQFGEPNMPPAEKGFKLVPTPAGYESPILKLAADESTNRQRWSEMPGLTSINYLGAVKPGALVLAEKPADEYGEREPLLIIQRYGKGRTVAFATASTWRWQMLLDAEDARHERFWRQFVRWMVASAPSRVNIDLGQTRRFAPGDEIPMAVSVYDRAYLGVDGADVEAQIKTPSGRVEPVTLQPELTETGTYAATFVPDDEGLYELEVQASLDGERIGSQVTSFLVRPSRQEFNNATLKRSFLQNLASVSNGVYYTVENAPALPENLRSRRTSTSIFRAEPLWDMPIIFILALLLLTGEWFYRRRKGLA